MPRLSKIRLTGCSYDGLQKEHENSIFDLSKDGHADHSLFTLGNGKGKGVMMQLIFQILLPDTKWGKNNGNKVISMFYDKKSNLIPSTFHVVLEWILDTVPEKRLITGIAVKAEMKNTSSEEEEKTGLSYFLYTHEKSENGYFTVENLPLYDKEKKKAADIDDLDNFINSNKRDFMRYSKSSVSRSDSDYYNYLKNRGIYRAEWQSLKAINKSEGGAGDYFIGAGDNRSIFDKIIIPTIAENIRNYSFDDGDNLIEMFRSNLSITKDLPILIKREGDYKELLAEIKPLIENAFVGTGFLDIKERLTIEGNDILFILKDQALFVDREIEKWEIESQKTRQKQEDLKYKKDNLQYSKHKNNIESKENEVLKLDNKRNKIIMEIQERKEKELLYRINKAQYFRKEVENKIKNKTMEKENLIEALGITDITARAKFLDDEIKEEFVKTKNTWMEIENQYSAYTNYMKGLREENKSKKKKYLDKMEELLKKDNLFLLKEEELTKEKRQLKENYDLLSLEFPERILEDLIQKEKEVQLKIERLKKEIEYYESKISEIAIESSNYNYQLENKDKTIKSLEKRAIEQEKQELEISRKISIQLIENIEAGLLSHSYFNKKQDKLETLKLEKQNNLEAIQRNIWEKNIDKLLNIEDYFIPNKDVENIKEEIKRLDINIETGTQYLNEIEEEDRKDILENNPGFIYSLVIGNERDWEIIHKNISEDLFLNNMVPIYIRSKMKSLNKESFKIVKSRADSLIDKNHYSVWKSKMENTIATLIGTENSIKEDLSNIDNLLQEIKIISLKDTALMLFQKIKFEKEERTEILEKLRILEEEKATIENIRSKTKNSLNKSMERAIGNTKNIEKINSYIEKIKEVQVERNQIEKVRIEIEELKKDMLALDRDTDRISNDQESTKGSYWEWKHKVQRSIEDLREIYKEISYHFEAKKNYSNKRSPNFILDQDRLKFLLGERRIIERDIATKNTRIAVLDSEIQHAGKDRSRYIKELEKLSSNWRRYEFLELSLNEMDIEINNLEKYIKTIEKEELRIKSDLDKINGNIEVMKEQLNDKEASIMKAHNRPALVIEVEDIDREINGVEREKESNEKYLDSCKEILERNKDKKIKFQINSNKIKNGYFLEEKKGKTSKILKDKLEENLDSIVDQWIRSFENNKRKIEESIDYGEKLRDRFIEEVAVKLDEERLRERIISTVKDLNVFSFKKNQESFRGMEENFQKEILRLSKDKDKAEKAMEQWTDRASMHVIKMIESLKSMVDSMNYINEQGHSFPLVKLKGKERLPKEKSEINHLLDEYFIQSVSQVLKEQEDIYNISDKDLKNIIGDKEIFSKALQGRYPILLVYKMSEKNEFKYAKARDQYYTTWEAINKGEGDLPEGSGGQTLSINTFVIMMIMSFKKKHIGNENPSTVLILDNPFGKASAKYILDPIFEIADKLNFQLICFAAPEIIKVEISERFPVFWELKIEDGKVVHGGRIIKQVND